MTAPNADRDRIMKRWREQLAKIERELGRGFLKQALWTELRDEIQQRHPNADGTFLVSYTSGYVADQMLLVRRLADTDPTTDSLASLIKRIQRNPRVLTRTRYAEQWASRVEDPSEHRIGEAVWDASFADPQDPEWLDLARLEGDAERLAAKLEHIVTWTDKTIAHLDPIAPERVPKFREVREALDLLAWVTERYQNLLKQSVTAEWMPTIGGDWQAPFRPSLFPLPFGAYRWPPPGGLI